MRALVISGGGSKGAFAGGVAQYLIEEQKIAYDIFVGSSTGGILVPHLALGNIDALKKAYTSVEASKIFSMAPFSVKEKGEDVEVGINYLNILKRFIKGEKTLGDSGNLHQYLREMLSEENFEALKKKQKDVVIAVSNLSRDTVEYKSVEDCSYDDFCRWMWISCNYMPFMSLVQQDDCDYADGGLGMNTPIVEAVNRGAKEIDVIMYDDKTTPNYRDPSGSIFGLLNNMISYLLDRVENLNILEGRLAAEKNNARLNFYCPQPALTGNPLIFNRQVMTKWWDLGFSVAQKQDNEPTKVF